MVSFWGIKMRVIAGSSKGKKLKSPTGKTRPLSDQAKEGLFNILQPHINGCSFLDLFAGSGGVGIEALSRGAKQAIFVELDKKTVQVIRENIKLCGAQERTKIFALDVLRALKILKRNQAKFDIIFVGAPYESPNLEKSMQELSDAILLENDALVVAEHRSKHSLANRFEFLEKVREVRYGDTVLAFYKKQ